MRLLLMRHGIAAPLGDGIESDAKRPLTDEGRRKRALLCRLADL
jgi:phosphohistidine phosphatase SixA